MPLFALCTLTRDRCGTQYPDHLAPKKLDHGKDEHMETKRGRHLPDQHSSITERTPLQGEQRIVQNRRRAQAVASKGSRAVHILVTTLAIASIIVGLASVYRTHIDVAMQILPFPSGFPQINIGNPVNQVSFVEANEGIVTTDASAAMRGNETQLSMFDHDDPRVQGVAQSEAPTLPLGTVLENVVAVSPEDAFGLEDIRSNATVS
eukprot:SAG31_NODE_5838_length_2304_cov_2.103949_2_plen_206_part_00